MNPEKALDILEGKIPHREPHKELLKESPKGPLEERKIPSPIKSRPFKEMKIAKNADTIILDKNFIKIFAVVLMVGVLIVVYLWKHAGMLEDSYKKGFNEGVA